MGFHLSSEPYGGKAQEVDMANNEIHIEDEQQVDLLIAAVEAVCLLSDYARTNKQVTPAMLRQVAATLLERAAFLERLA